MSREPQPKAVNRLRNDVDDIYDMLGVIHGTLGEHGRKLDQHTATLDEHSAILGEHGRKLDRHTATLGEHGRKLDHIIGLLEAS